MCIHICLPICLQNHFWCNIYQVCCTLKSVRQYTCKTIIDLIHFLYLYLHLLKKKEKKRKSFTDLIWNLHWTWLCRSCHGFRCPFQYKIRLDKSTSIWYKSLITILI
jgi:hypothetical protein